MHAVIKTDVRQMGNPIAHVEIPVTNLEREKEFYSKVFGWKVYESQVSLCLNQVHQLAEASAKLIRSKAVDVFSI
jgi:predicted enzyme related to lactoylglutathione lyase